MRKKCATHDIVRLKCAHTLRRHTVERYYFIVNGKKKQTIYARNF